jgi:hypothetical protein
MFDKIKGSLDDMRYYAGLRREWRRATTVPELAERGARWCRGELGAHPSGYDVPDAETSALLPVLARANEAGFFTYQSQPGGVFHEDGQTVRTRAFVDGFLERERVEGFRAVMGASGLLVLDSLAHDEPTVFYEHAGMVGGRWKERREGYLDHISDAARRSLADAADLTVIDTCWAREELLWTALDSWSHGA